MSTAPSETQISQSQLKIFSKPVQKLVRKAEEYGATVRMTSNGHVQIRTDAGTMSLSRNSGSGHIPMHKVVKDFKRCFPFYDPATQTIADAIPAPTIEAMREAAEKLQAERDAVAPLPPEKRVPVIIEVEGLGVVGETSMAASEIHKAKKAGNARWEPDDNTISITGTEPNKLEVVSTRPWLAKKSHGKLGDQRYESPWVVERTWSDGELDYICTFAECGYNNKNPRSVASHAARSKDHVLAERAEPILVQTDVSTPPSYSQSYSPRSDRVAALAAYLESLEESGKMDPNSYEEIARATLVWQHEQRGDSEDKEPLTADDVLDKIRRLVDNGEYMRQRAAMEQLTEDLEAARLETEIAREEAATCSARSASLVDEIESIKDLIGSIGK